MTWIAVDWGSSNMRAWRMDGARVLESARSPEGAVSLEADGFEAALLALVEGWLVGPTDVVICGMAGAREGWIEAGYTPVPCAVETPACVVPPVSDARLRVRILPGLSQLSPRPDVMRGEETQIAGLLAEDPKFDGVICLPGTHTKWAHVCAGEVVSFQTFMTGEMFALLSTQSVLRKTVVEGDWDASAFEDGVSSALSRPEALASQLFTLRTDPLLNGASPVSGFARLSGLLIGAEIAAAKPYWLGQRVALIGADRVCDPYDAALLMQGVRASRHDASDLTVAGLHMAHLYLNKEVA